ncbi:hypothetical protein [Rhabdothermincola salaria]|uniref:hypothetical protein n=1 Tax=Rhabdothermincola salaria TaxID=2903142 RepID=UPI001E3F9EED|nr:hypothetical protein [Rhabdothermincola salaria]MCD9625699.1 hypothetical protein [Rhabdothermincola salaria]
MTADDPGQDRPADPPRRYIPIWLLPLLIGVITIIAGIFTWRAGQLGSTAAYEDRQSVGQTIVQQQQATEVALAAITDAVAYVRYVAAYAEADAIDALLPTLRDQGADDLADTFATQADEQRVAASDLAYASGLFGEQTLLTQLVAAPDDPLSFDLDAQIEVLQAEVTTGLASPGVPNPDDWAERADDTRDRVRNLRWATLLLLVAVVFYTAAQLTDRVLTRRVGTALGSTLALTVVVTTVVTVF